MGLNGGGTIVFPHTVTHLDAGDVWSTVEREGIKTFTVVGDAMLRPLLDELQCGTYDTSSLVAVGNGGAPLTAETRNRVHILLPSAVLSDTVGASETGTQMSTRSDLHDDPAQAELQDGPPSFRPGSLTIVVDEQMEAEVLPGHEGMGWLAQRGIVPLGYLGDEAKSRRTFPEIGGVRYAIPGDRARLLANGNIELIGRDSSVINSGGEKIFAEEVERALNRHPAIADVIVVGRPSERWGHEVVALVQVDPGRRVTSQEVIDEGARSLARFKLPKSVIFVPQVVRFPSGKPDYRWAKDRAGAAS
jgi:acyl-CoA synthetase (AMP-forming)/AMP-acid ligase II